MAASPDPATILSSLPAPLQYALSVGTGLAALGAAVYRIAKKPAVAPPTASEKPDKADVSDAARNLGVAVVAPFGDANQFRLLQDAVKRLGDFTEKSVEYLDDLRDETKRTTAAVGRGEDAINRVEAAIGRLVQAITSNSNSAGRT